MRGAIYYWTVQFATVSSFFVKFIYLEIDRDSVSGGRAEREGEREPQAGSMLLVQSPMRGLNSQNCEIIT